MMLGSRFYVSDKVGRFSPPQVFGGGGCTRGHH